MSTRSPAPDVAPVVRDQLLTVHLSQLELDSLGALAAYAGVRPGDVARALLHAGATFLRQLDAHPGLRDDGACVPQDVIATLEAFIRPLRHLSALGAAVGRDLDDGDGDGAADDHSGVCASFSPMVETEGRPKGAGFELRCDLTAGHPGKHVAMAGATPALSWGCDLPPRRPYAETFEEHDAIRDATDDGADLRERSRELGGWDSRS